MSEAQDTWNPGQLAHYDQALAAEGHLVFLQEYRKAGEEYVPVDRGQIPEGYISFPLMPIKGDDVSVMTLVLDPRRIDHIVVPLTDLPIGPKDPEEASVIAAQMRDEDRRERERLQSEGYTNIVTQFGETGNPEEGNLVQHKNLIAIRPKFATPNV